MAGTILRLQLLGDFDLRQGDEPVPGINKPRLQALIAYLILRAGTPVARQQLAAALWPDTLDSLARNNLRQLLHTLRGALPEPDRWLAVDAQTVAWRLDPLQAIDVLQFEQALAEAEAASQRGDPHMARQRLTSALKHYRGELLPACYADWIAPERERLRQKQLSALRRLAGLLEEQQDYAAALAPAQQLLRLDALDEDTYLALIRLHGLNQDRQAVRRVYQSAVDTFQRELGLRPDTRLREAYERWLRAPAAPTLLAEAGATALRLVGRQAEWQVMQAAWRQAAAGQAQLLLITGEAGIGKSRLAEELFHWSRRQGASVAHTRCYAAEGRLSLAPVTDWLRSDALRSHWPALDDVWLSELSRLVPELLTERADLARPEPISEYGQRQRFFEALARAMSTAPRALLLWIDDLQWSDPETLEWLHFLLRFRPQNPLLVVGTARSEESPPDHPLSGLARQLRAEGRLVSCELSALDAAETARLAEEIEGHDLDVKTSLRLFSETEGNPLFVVETVRAALGGAARDRAAAPEAGLLEPQRALPPRVYALIAGRLAQLSPASRKVAEMGAAIGRAFSLELLLRAGTGSEESIIAALDELWHKRIVRELSVNQFDFTHDKLREVAYAELAGPQCRLLHRRIAQALEALNAPHPGAICTQIAAQYEQAGLPAQALPYYLQAAEAAALVYANDSAINLYARALALLRELPADTDRDRQELRAQLALAALYRITKGWVSPEVDRTLDRALVLSNQVGDVGQRAQANYGLQALHVVAARLDQVEEAFAEVTKLFLEAEGHPPPLLAGLMYAGAQLHKGRPQAARERLEHIITQRNERQVRDLQAAQGWNYLAHGNAWLSHTLWCLGYPQQALATGQAAVQIAADYAQPFNRALTVNYLAMLYEMCNSPSAFRAQAEEAQSLAREYQAPYYHAWSSILVDFARAWDDPAQQNLAQLRTTIDAFSGSGAHLRLPYFLALLARAYRKAGQLAAAQAAVAEALDESRRNHEYWWDAELHRLRGEFLREGGAPAPDVEAALQQALAIARAQQMRSLELRAATSLASWWQAAGRSGEARQMLAPVYDWFTEGQDTPDLQAARALIAQL